MKQWIALISKDNKLTHIEVCNIFINKIIIRNDKLEVECDICDLTIPREVRSSSKDYNLWQFRRKLL